MATQAFLERQRVEMNCQVPVRTNPSYSGLASRVTSNPWRTSMLRTRTD